MSEPAASNDGFIATIVIPMRNEAPFIETCIDALGQQDLPLEALEVIVVDGDSTDGSADIARSALKQREFGRAEVVVNPVGTTPSNLNQGLSHATSPVVCRVDARSIVPPDYVRRCATLLTERPDVAVTGGSQVAQARSKQRRDRGIARALNNRWAMGMSKYRRGGPSGASDTVYLGSFRTDDLHESGGWDERLTTNQDFELNRRMAERGIIWFQTDLAVGYIPRADHAGLLQQYLRFGAAKVSYWRTTGDRPQPRQLAALAIAPAGVCATVVWLRLGSRSQVMTAIATLSGVAAIESLGATDRDPDPRVRGWSLAAMAAVWGGWSIGAWRSLLHPRSSQESSTSDSRVRP
ncbi:MAG: glycosyltransferase [Aquihabitans sp.]